MTHIAITEPRNGMNVEWMEKVTDEQYNALRRRVQSRSPQATADHRKTVRTCSATNRAGTCDAYGRCAVRRCVEAI